MLGWLKGRSQHRHTGQQLYELIVAQSRDPALYEAYGAPDTMDGRLELVLLHTVLVLERLQSEGASSQRIGQHLMEQLVASTDDALRRIGLGDDSVAPRIKRLANALMERARDYRAAIEADAEPASANAPPARGSAPARLELALLEHVYGVDPASITDAQAAQARQLAAYARRVRTALTTLPGDALLTGRLTFPPVAATVTRSEETRA